MQCYLIHFLFLESSYCRYLYRTFMSSQCCKIFPKWVLYSIRWYVQSQITIYKKIIYIRSQYRLKNLYDFL